MRVVAVNGSPRKSGNTARLLKEISGMAEDKGAEVKYFDLVDLKFEDCRACYQCNKTGTCSITDELDAVKEEIAKADVVVLASPIYMGGETGLMKCLIDRLYSFFRPTGEPGVYQSELSPGKRGFVFFTCGQIDGDKIYNYLNLRYFNLLIKRLQFRDLRTFIIGGANPSVDIRKSTRAKDMLKEAERFLGSD
jgi:multimeric flavodoxin WrbA